MSSTFCLQITEANHIENEFFTLGGAGFLTEAPSTTRRWRRRRSGTRPR